MNRFLSLALRFGLAGGCLTYALWGVDFSRLWPVLAEFSPGFVALYALAVLATTLIPGLRLRFLVNGRISPLTGLRACLLGLACNNVLPARLGEVAKAGYLRQEASISLGRALEAVFWERFFDLSALLVLGVAVAALLGQGALLYPLLAVVGGGWGFLVLVWVRPRAAQACLRLVPGERLRLFAGEMLGLLKARLCPGFLLRLGLWTGLAWAGYAGAYGLGLCLMAGLPADPTLVLTVFAVVTLGFALPAAPGGMGVFEASAVLALGWFGVDRERAFAVGLALHMLQYIPVTLIGLGVLATSGLSLAKLRQQAEKPGL
ncbi:lysylphosphatidylglycerol synthase transmembrane domain-containing protein [Solidesulfovibrio sp.]